MDNKEKKHKIAVFANGWSAEFIGLVLDRILKRAEADKTDVFIYVDFVLAIQPHNIKIG